MKRAILMSVLGAAACLLANQAQAQGSIVFCNYASSVITAPVTYFDYTGPGSGGYTNGETIGQPFTAALLYSLDGGTTYTVAATTGFLFPTGTPLASGGGLFGNQSNAVTIPGYTSGPVDFIVQVYNGPSYAASTLKGIGVAVASELSTASNTMPIGNLFDSQMTTPLSAFTVGPVPEPATMALGGLGLAAWMLFRRKRVQ